MNNRILKFRVWNKYNNSYQYNLSIDCNGKLVEIDEKFQSAYVIQQYTGLKDKNEREIYEGDIIKQTMAEGPNLPDRFKNHILQNEQIIDEVKWGKYVDGEYVDSIECWMFNYDSLSELINRTKGQYQEYIRTYEIIGNIFETPELLK